MPAATEKTKCSYEVTFRPMAERDLPYVKDTFARTMMDAGASKHIHGPIFKRGTRRLIDLMHTHRDAAQCWVATPPAYPELLLGWAIVERTDYGACVHYVYIKGAYRRAGVASSLVSFVFDLLGVDPSGDIRFSHWRLPAGRLARARKWRFDPYALMEPTDETAPRAV